MKNHILHFSCINVPITILLKDQWFLTVVKSNISIVLLNPNLLNIVKNPIV